MRGSRRLRLVLVLLALTAFTLTTLDLRSGTGSPFDPLRRGADTLFGPAERFVGGLASSVGNALGALPRLASYRSDNRRLELENSRLREQLHETDDLRRQAASWNRLLRLADLGSETIVPARVVSVSPSLGFEWTATIDLGTRDGITANETVVNGDGLVGRTKRVGPDTSVVVLVADPAFAVGVRLARSGAFGIASGNALRPMTYQLIGPNSRANLGDTFLTTGSGTFVSGVPVGKVTSVDTSTNTLTRNGLLAPFVDVTRLDLVGVVTQGPRTLPRPAITPAPLPSPSPSPAPSPGGSPAPSPAPSRSPGPAAARSSSPRPSHTP